jgi:hypothetical protein
MIMMSSYDDDDEFIHSCQVKLKVKISLKIVRKKREYEIMKEIKESLNYNRESDET